MRILYMHGAENGYIIFRTSLEPKLKLLRLLLIVISVPLSKS